MAGIPRQKRARGHSQAASDAGKGPERAGVHDAQRQAGGRPIAAEAEPVAASWNAAQRRLKALESPDNPVCIVYWPEPVGDVWGGAYGGAKIRAGAPQAVTSDGKEHAIA